MNKISFLAIFMIGAQLSSCRTSESIIALARVRNYDPKDASHILFLDFKITKRRSEVEAVTLVNAVSGSGKLKNVAVPVHSAYQIIVIPRYSFGQLETPLIFEHPLYKSVEVPGQDDKLTKHDLNAEEGMLSVRIQQDNGLEKLEMYSLTPEKDSIKIYTLNLK